MQQFSREDISLFGNLVQKIVEIERRFSCSILKRFKKQGFFYDLLWSIEHFMIIFPDFCNFLWYFMINGSPE